MLPHADAALWQTSGGRRVLGLPTITWQGLLTVPPVVVVGYLNLTDSASGTSLQGQPQALLAWMAILPAGLLTYVVALTVQTRRGVPMGLAFTSLPPE